MCHNILYKILLTNLFSIIFSVNYNLDKNTLNLTIIYVVFKSNLMYIFTLFNDIY